MFEILIKASISIFILWSFYKLFLQKESFFAANRFYLLACLVIACALPFVSIPELVNNQGIITSLIEQEAEPQVEPIVSGDPEALELEDTLQSTGSSEITAPPWTEPASQQRPQTTRSKGPQFWLFIAYLFGVVVFSLNLVSQLISLLFRVIKSSDNIKDIGSTIVNSPVAKEPCSFFNYIFINPEAYDFETYEQIIAHEKIHVDQLHSVDLLLSELAVILLWFNPFIWLFRKEVEKNIEYQTDVLLLNGNTIKKKEYQMNLVKVAAYSKPLAITTNYNQSLIKQRILMMNAKKSRPHSYWKYAFIAPVILLTLLLLNKPQVLQAQDKGQELASAMAEEPLKTINDNRIEIVAEEDDKVEPGDLSDDVSINDPECKALLKAIKAEDLVQVENLLKTTDANCIDLHPESEVYITPGGSQYIMSGPRTPLVAAARIGNVAMGQLLLNAQAEVKFQAKNDPSPLMMASSLGHLEFVKFLLNNGAEINRVLPNEGTAVLFAARNGQLEVVKYLHSVGADINLTVKNEGSPVLVAARNGHLETVQYLYSNGADINKKVDNEGTPLLVAARNGHTETVKFLYQEGADINAKVSGEGTPLLVASRNGHNETLEFLISNGAEVNATVPGEGTALLAAARNGHTQTAEFLISKGADVNAQVSGEGTALLAAARNGHTETMEFLLSKGADINAKVNGEGSALIAAARNGHIGTMEFLLSKGADVNGQVPGEGTALLAAARNGHTKTAEFLISKGADVNAQVSGEGTALLAAARNGHTETMEFLLSKGADINAKVDGEGSAIIAASRNGHKGTVTYLLGKGADINSTVDGEGTPLLVAARNGHEDLVTFLISQGATVDLVTNGEGTALSAAVRNLHYEVAKILLENGADPYLNAAGEEYPMFHARRSNDKSMIDLLKQYEKED